MAILTITNTLAAGSKVKASEHNTNYSDISTWLNNLYTGASTWSVTQATNVYFGTGTAALPGCSLIGDTTTGFHQVSAGVLGISISGAKSADFFSTGATNATSYTPFRLFSGGKTKTFDAQTKTGCTTSAVNILTNTSDGSLVMIYGKQTIGGGAEFFDLLIYASSAVSSPIAQLSASGSPDTRTYTASGANLRLQMGGNTYTVTAFGIGTAG